MDAAEAWQAILRAHTDDDLCGALADRMREGRLVFGGRLLCPFLRPFFLDARDEARVARASESLWRLGERFVRAAAGDRSLRDAVGMSVAEIELAEVGPGPGPDSVAGRAVKVIHPARSSLGAYT